MTDAVRKPRIGLMGEFSAGKSTLSNLLLGARPLPEKVTATRLSPVWLSHGTGAPYRIDVDGTQEPISLDKLEEIGVEETRAIRLFFESEILQSCDLIDFPGISDPNMSSDVWERMLCEVDAILWCTHATQAWRQSEAAVWDTIPKEIREKSVLLVTRFDKLTTERDKYRVIARLGKETKGLFAATFPIALIEALEAGDDRDAFEKSGAGPFMQHLAHMIDGLKSAPDEVGQALEERVDEPQVAQPQSVEAPMPNTPVADQEVARPADAKIPRDDTVSSFELDLKDNDTIEFLPTNSGATEMSKKDGIEQPVLNIDSSKPVLRVDSPRPVAGMSGADHLQVIPKRVKPKGDARSSRPQRPTGNGQVLTREALELDYDLGGVPKAEPKQLRSIFKAE